jgi:hypothetical protein
MDELREKASQGPEATRMQDVNEGDEFIIENPALYGPDEVSSDGDYPQYGDWFSLVDGDGDQAGFLECPRALAQAVVDAVDYQDVGFPMSVTVVHVELADDEWRVEISAEVAE